MEDAVSDAELNDLLKSPNYTIVLNDSFPKSSRLDDVILEVLGYDSRRLLIGSILQGQGVSLMTNGNKSFMEVGIAEDPQTTMGKIYGPNKTLLHTVELEDNDGDSDYWNIMRNGEQFVKLEIHSLAKAMPCLSTIFKCCLCMKGDREITYHRLSEPSQVGRTAPGICRTGKNVILYFQPEATTEERLALLGTSVLFIIDVLYPEYGKWVRFGEAV